MVFGEYQEQQAEQAQRAQQTQQAVVVVEGLVVGPVVAVASLLAAPPRP